ncbi:N-acetylmuramoyl-L-alanine amidase [Ruegeria sp. 2205SS24-7]|uniref:N-acetylmuramoyl-L-alanine amidase n=1 Tax=Ruegeria discodermiae TaxID=3064389 RepID=UPI002741BEC5|nr:N-acetylmuramoyl-L-alanine amidase [Ruegeria sp. 2205SS24-7]MDP5215990.1 N-acetylmuramoyl-L-alanine amidase [Ruegeria sp. 2205SS24-7]
MSRIFKIATLALGLVFALTGVLWAQGFGGLARVDAGRSLITDAGREVGVDLHLSQGVPYRVFTLDSPPRLVLDFKEVDWSGLDASDLNKSARISDVKFGTYVPGWSRMVLALTGTLSVAQAGLEVDPVTGGAHLAIRLAPVEAEDFAAAAGALRDPRWDLPDPQQFDRPSPRRADAPLRVMLDPGHGGIDPGAETEQVVEKHLVLTFARELRELLVRSDRFEVTLTRDADYFVSLERRIALAHEAGADIFISLHADALAEGQAHGATVYTLSDEASDIASAKLAERHDRDDLLSGVDLSDTDDEVTDILLDLARQETRPRSQTLARVLVDNIAAQGTPMNRRPLRSASFSVLKAADIPSVLIEIGFLSSPRDLENLVDPAWRATMATGIRNALQDWRAQDQARRALVRH